MLLNPKGMREISKFLLFFKVSKEKLFRTLTTIKFCALCFNSLYVDKLIEILSNKIIDSFSQYFIESIIFIFFISFSFMLKHFNMVYNA